MANIPNKLTANPSELTRRSWLVFISGGSILMYYEQGFQKSERNNVQSLHSFEDDEY
jgi:hypothetical protein